MVLHNDRIFSLWSAHWIIRIYQKAVCPECVQRVGVFGSVNVPNVRIHRSTTAGYGDHVFRRNSPISHLEDLLLRSPGEHYINSKTKCLGVDKLQKRLIA